MSLKRGSSEVSCAKDPDLCIADYLRSIIVHCPGYFIPLDLIVDHIECSEHNRCISTSHSSFYSTLGMVRMRLNLDRSVREANKTLLNVQWSKPECQKLIWKIGSHVHGPGLMDIIRCQQDLHIWVSSASLHDLCRNRVLINLLVDRNPEYFAFIRALQERLKTVDVHCMFDLPSSPSFKFLEMCFAERFSDVIAISPGDHPIYDVLGNVDEEIVDASDLVKCIRVKDHVVRVDFPRVSRFVKMESNAKLVHMDCKVQAFYNELNCLLPSLVCIGTDTFRPRIYTYRAVVVGNLSVKEAVGGETLLQWMKNMRVQNITEFALSVSVNSVARHICGISDRHPNNIIIIPESNQYVNIDNKYGLGLSKPLGVDSYGVGMLSGLRDFLGETLMEEIECICIQLLRHLRICHSADIISIGKIIFHDLAAASYLESYFTSRLENEEELASSFATAIQNAAKHTIQIIKSGIN